MSENQMKDRIIDELKKAKEAGSVTSEKLYDIAKRVVADTVAESKEGVEVIRPIVKNALSESVEVLKTTGMDVEKNIKAVLEGAVAGVRVHKDQAVSVAKKELREVEEKLTAEKADLAQAVKDALHGAKDAGALLPEEIRARIEALSTDIKLKSTELFGLTEQTVKKTGKEAVQTTVKAAGKMTNLMTKEVKGFGKKSLNVAKGAGSGLWKGVKDALQKDKDEH
jgi:hypothetical protein